MLTTDEVRKIAKLSRLYLTDEEVETYREQIGSILEYVKKLQELNTDDVPELQHAADVVNIFRDDVLASCDPNIRRMALENFVHRNGDLLEVQAVFDR